MKTHDEIKKGLECCSKPFGFGTCTNTCPFDDDETDEIYNCTSALAKDALAYITQLESRLAQAERERDAAVHDVKSLCATNYFSGDYCEYCKHREPDGQCFHDCLPYRKWGWEWRGVCKEEQQ